MSSRQRWFVAFASFLFMILLAVFSVASASAQDRHDQRLPKRIVDDYGYWSKYQNPSYSLFLKHVPGVQLNMGTRFYGYQYTNVNQLSGLCPNAATSSDGACDNLVLTMNYGPDIKHLINREGWYTQCDPRAFVPNMLRVDGSDGYITYDDPLSTYFRVWCSDWNRGLGDTFMWSLDADYDGHSQDLLDAMYWATVSGH